MPCLHTASEGLGPVEFLRGNKSGGALLPYSPKDVQMPLIGIGGLSLVEKRSDQDEQTAYDKTLSDAHDLTGIGLYGFPRFGGERPNPADHAHQPASDRDDTLYCIPGMEPIHRQFWERDLHDLLR